MTHFDKQHYVFNFRNPGLDIPNTSWSDVFSGKKNKIKNTDVDLANIITKAIKLALESKEDTETEYSQSENQQLYITNRFFTIVEVLMNINKLP